MEVGGFHRNEGYIKCSRRLETCSHQLHFMQQFWFLPPPPQIRLIFCPISSSKKNTKHHRHKRHQSTFWDVTLPDTLAHLFWIVLDLTCRGRSTRTNVSKHLTPSWRSGGLCVKNNFSLAGSEMVDCDGVTGLPVKNTTNKKMWWVFFNHCKISKMSLPHFCCFALKVTNWRQIIVN